MKKLLLIFSLLVFAAGCEKAEDEITATILVANREITADASAHAGMKIHYTVQRSDNGQAGAVKASADAGWIFGIDNPAVGVIEFNIEENVNTQSRTGHIILTYANAADVTVTVKQAGNNGGNGDKDDDDDDDDDGDKDDDDDDDDGKGGNTPENVYRTGWPELPVTYEYVYQTNYRRDNNNSDYYYAHHLCPDVNNAQGNGKARNYTVCFSAQHHCPLWVAAPRHAKYETGSGRSEAYKADPNIPSDLQYTTKTTGSSGCSKGHMLGSAERTVTSATNAQVFYYSNIAPQETSTFNTGGGAWNNLEDWVDKKVCADTTYVVIGAYFDNYTDKLRGHNATAKKISFCGRNDVSWPTMFYYILLRTKKGNTGKSVAECSADDLMCAAFVRSHNCAKGTAVSRQDMMSVADLEKITGFVYFPNVPNAPKETFNASDWGL